MTVVRPMSVGDAEDVALLCGQWGYPSTAAEVEERLGPVLTDPSHVLLVAEGEDGSAVGWVHAFAWYSLAAPPALEVVGLVVDEAARGGGIGRVLMSAVEQWAAERSLAPVRLRSAAGRHEAHAFYERIGYEHYKTQHAFRQVS